MAETGRRWQPGETAVLRYITRDGRPGMAWPYHVVEDRDDLLALHIPRGSTYKNWRRTPIDDGGKYRAARQLADDRWRRDVLRLMFPGQHHSVWLFWSDDDERRFSAYYINMEEPFRRTSIGFDTNDHTLDVVVTPDHEWRWKDVEPPDSPVASRDDEETKEGDIEALVAAEERGKQQARDDDVEEGWNRFVAEQSGELG